MKIAFRHAQLIIAMTFLTFLVLQAIAVGSTFARDAIYAKELEAIILKFLAIYSVPISVIAGGTIAKGFKRQSQVPGGLFWLAFILSLVWNLALGWRSVDFALSQEDSVADLLSYIEAISSGGAFLVSGTLAYFFSKQ